MNTGAATPQPPGGPDLPTGGAVSAQAGPAIGTARAFSVSAFIVQAAGAAQSLITRADDPATTPEVRTILLDLAQKLQDLIEQGTRFETDRAAGDKTERFRFGLNLAVGVVCFIAGVVVTVVVALR